MKETPSRTKQRMLRVCARFFVWFFMSFYMECSLLSLIAVVSANLYIFCDSNMILRDCPWCVVFLPPKNYLKLLCFASYGIYAFHCANIQFAFKIVMVIEFSECIYVVFYCAHILLSRNDVATLVWWQFQHCNSFVIIISCC